MPGCSSAVWCSLHVFHLCSPTRLPCEWGHIKELQVGYNWELIYGSIVILLRLIWSLMWTLGQSSLWCPGNACRLVLIPCCSNPSPEMLNALAWQKSFVPWGGFHAHPKHRGALICILVLPSFFCTVIQCHCLWTLVKHHPHMPILYIYAVCSSL